MNFSPAVRISFGLVSLTISLLFLGKVIGFAPDRDKAVLEARKNLSEALAVQFSAAAQRGDLTLIKTTLESIVERDNGIVSSALRSSSGGLLAEAGHHLSHWQPPDDGRSTPTHVQIPIYRGQKRWATVELSFRPLWADTMASGFKNSYLSLILFIACTGFSGYFLLIKRTLRELDPSAVVPERVRAAFDVLQEGVLILDQEETIVLANTSFAELIGKSSSALVGFKGSELGWKGYRSPSRHDQLPWMQVLQGEKNISGLRMEIDRGDTAIIFIVNAAPILDGKGKERGVLVTCDNVTELEETNLTLKQTVTKLQITTEEVQTKNLELEFLATRDPLTLLLNRRAFNRDFATAFKEAQQNGSELSCIMCDIDHFKSVNDRYGHATGDKVIKMVAGQLQKNCRETDLVGRYGGEEFCLVLPGIDIEKAANIGNRIRRLIKEDTSSGVQVTMSFGVASLRDNAPEPGELSNQADRALYIAKESGRNRVVCWGDDEAMVKSAGQDEEQTAALEKQSSEVKAVVTQNRQTDDSDEIQRLTVRLQEVEKLAEMRAQELNHFTSIDETTGLPSRLLFYDRITQALTRGRRYENIVAVLSLSVDTVGRVNETMGRSSGDRLLKAIGNRLVNTLREMDTVAQLPSSSLAPTVSRLGEEDFGILLIDLEEVQAITWIVKRIFKALEPSFQLEDKEFYLKTDIGISIYPDDGQTSEELERNAVAAKSYARKQVGENRYCYFSSSIHEGSNNHLQIESQLHRAVHNGEFLLYYQPKIEARTGAICGMEALIRWNHPERGLVLPHEFIHVAEYSGLIGAIGEWVLITACKQVRTWIDMGLDQCSVAVNLSNKQFRKKDLSALIKEILQENGLDPGCLLIEVTETAMNDNITSAMEILEDISCLGVGIALDDFGTGYSSLGYLKTLPVSYVKIDRSFVADVGNNERDASLVQSIISMAHGMGMKVTAEGVETQAQADLLGQFGSDELQGYLFSKPVTAADATKMLAEATTYRFAA